MADYTGRDQRLKYLFANGGGGGGSCKVISGYYHDGDFYEDQSYTQIITGDTKCLYIDLDTTTLYLFDGTDYVEVQGGSSGGGTSSTDIYLGNIVLYTGKLYGGGASSWTNFMLAYRDSTGTASNTLDYTLKSMINTLLPNGLKGGTVKYRLSLFAFGNSSTPIKVGINGQELISAHNPWAGSTRFVDFTMSNYFTFDELPHETAYAYTTTNDAYNFKIKTDSNAGFDTLVLHAYLVGANTANMHTYTTTEQVVGTWIDGETIYEATVTSGDPVPTGAVLIERTTMASTGYDVIRYTKPT